MSRTSQTDLIECWCTRPAAWVVVRGDIWMEEEPEPRCDSHAAEATMSGRRVERLDPGDRDPSWWAFPPSTIGDLYDPAIADEL
jgi:hypothetical protein